MLMLGHSGAGKTCLLMRYIHQCFTETFITTIGIDYKIKFSTCDDMIYRVMWWDTAGQETYDRLRPLSYPQTDVILICFSIDRSHQTPFLIEKESLP